MSTLGVITNPTSGSGRGARWGSEALALLAARGHRLRDLSAGTWASSYATAMAGREGLDAIVVVGGDGMAHLGVQVCAETDLPLGIVAAGSGNDAALSLGLPVHDIAAAVATIENGLSGTATRIDVGKIDGAGVEEPATPRYFVAVLSAGLDAAVAAYGNRLSFPRGPLKYKVATARELPRFRPYGVSVTVDGVEESQQCTLVAVANGPVFGGGLCISRGSSLVDGRLELVVADAVSRTRVARLFPKLYDGSIVDEDCVRVIAGKHIRIAPASLGADLPPAFADGELVGAAPLDVRAVPGALQVLGGRADSLRA